MVIYFDVLPTNIGPAIPRYDKAKAKPAFVWSGKKLATLREGTSFLVPMHPVGADALRGLCFAFQKAEAKGLEQGCIVADQSTGEIGFFAQ